MHVHVLLAYKFMQVCIAILSALTETLKNYYIIIHRPILPMLVGRK